ncbi:hypothetical protein [Pseudomonas aeruginosa]|uniref:hypothetical protein n=1 Tax=Pseudomonas aeruginosa TaxID=287 RepID=UPI00053DE5B1|nr:hypothetical protein [Pseudomonas aeruginosa]HCF1906794.1 hypothetical protein [Pseudomonas aeruginosa]HCF1911847.1 hypothetical protein [Pseudomonas aeruginosa]HCF3676630.1 hypothetical protein [Pseudomonas aeruginosa]HCL3367894.1 hypothetical protein [Pseudomonas aeruginosa]HCU2536849.1 hypothetical protein [Pseudomonas aeruginosa]
MHAKAGSPHASLPDSDVALLANILVLATRNMNNMTTMLAHLSVELSQSEEPRLQRVGHRVLNELSELGAALETQWDLIGALARFSPLLERTLPRQEPLVTEIHLTELPGQALPPSA